MKAVRVWRTLTQAEIILRESSFDVLHRTLVVGRVKEYSEF